MDDILINNKGEAWNHSRSTDIDLLDVEKLMLWVSMNKKTLEFGIKYSRKDVVAYDFMKRNISYVNRHYELSLPWKNNFAVLPKSLPNAQRRLQYLKQHFEKNLDLHEKYTEQVETYIQRGYAKKLPENDPGGACTWYLLSVCGSQERYVLYLIAPPSLTASPLMIGPNSVSLIVEVLLQFHKYLVAVIADIEAVFHQVHAPHALS